MEGAALDCHAWIGVHMHVVSFAILDPSVPLHPGWAAHRLQRLPAGPVPHRRVQGRGWWVLFLSVITRHRLLTTTRIILPVILSRLCNRAGLEPMSCLSDARPFLRPPLQRMRSWQALLRAQSPL